MIEYDDNDAISKQGACSLRKSVVGQKKPVWVRAWRSVHLGWSSVFVVLFAVLAATIATVVLLFGTLDSDILLSMAWLAFVVLVPLALAVVLSGIGGARLSRFVRPVDVAGVGRGLAVPGRGAVLYRSGTLALALLVGVSYFRWRGDEPVGPARHQLRTEIMAYFGAPIFVLFFALSVLIVNRTGISLHPDGIVQEIYRRRGWKVVRDITVVPWDKISDLQPQGHPNPAMSHPHWYPTIRVVYRGDSIESDRILVLMACEKKVEPNSLFALLLWCRDNPWAREQLGRDEARELLRPPGLFERIRTDLAASAPAAKDVVQ
ncbi:UDP-2,3-diacylglucosamine hydrolase [Rhodococcus sp. AW25M09]|nr:UDP-2,3-diacylglucosamine hydrolase [Rhodococcus sp. AW25M09]